MSGLTAKNTSTIIVFIILFIAIIGLPTVVLTKPTTESSKLPNRGNGAARAASTNNGQSLDGDVDGSTATLLNSNGTSTMVANEEDEDEEDYDDGDDEEDDQTAAIVAETIKNSTGALSRQVMASTARDNGTVLEDLFGNLVKVDSNRVALVGNNARDMGAFALKALLLGPLIGITLKGALIRGLVWALISYGIHLTFPAILTTLGLGTGLVGFARQLQPEYVHMLLPQLVNIPVALQHFLPASVTQMTNQYVKVFGPVIESISSIPDEACRHRAVCEVASYLIQNSPFMSNSLQRISATVYVNFGTDYSKAWLDGIVQSDCATKYAHCPSSPFSLMASRLAEALRNSNLQNFTQAGASVAPIAQTTSSASMVTQAATAPIATP